MKKKGLFVTGILSIVVIIAVFYYVSGHENAMNHKDEMVSGESTTEGNTSEEKKVKQSEQSEQKNNKKNESSENGSSEISQESEGEVIVGEPNPAIYGTDSDNKTKSPNKKEDENSYISFPYVSDSDHLIIQDIYNYSGYYIEDGTESEVENIAVIEVKNTAQSAMEYGEIHLKTGGDTLSFHVSLLPAGETAIVMEADKKAYDEIVTAYHTIEAKDNYSYMEIELITGKTHQIRAHLSAYGHPIVGDSKYGGKRKEGVYPKYQLLHAYRVVFPTLDGELTHLSNKEFICEEPETFKRFKDIIF